MRRTDRLAALLSTTALSDAARTEALSLLRGPVHWRAFEVCSVREGTAAVAYAHLRSEPFSREVPPVVRERLRGLYVANAARNLHHFRALEEALTTLDGAGLRAGVLKGPHLATIAYPDPALRPMGDLDLLVRPAEAPRAADVLAGIGFAPMEPIPRPLSSESYRNSVLLRRADGGPGGLVHLHWHVANAAFPLPFYRGVDPDRIWDEMVPWTFRGRPAWVPSPRFLPAFLAEHALKHSFTPLIHLVDLAQILRSRPPGVDGPTPFGLGPALAVAEATARSVFAWTDGGEGASRRAALGPGGDLVRRLAAAGWRRPGLCHLAYLHGLPSMAERLRFVGGLWFPPAAVLARLEGIEPCSVRPRHYVRRFGRGVRWGLRFFSPGSGRAHT